MEGMNSNQRTIYITKTYKQRIKKTHPLYELFTDITIKSKNLYNLALYTERQYYFENKKIISRFNLISILNKTDAYKQLPSQTSNATIDQVYQTFNSLPQSNEGILQKPIKIPRKAKDSRI